MIGRRLSALQERWGKEPVAIAGLVLATIACLLPFIGKALHMDDPLFLWAGRQMQNRWWDPYGFNVNWYGTLNPMHEVTMNPPMASAYLALLLTISNGAEVFLHVGFLLQAVAAVLGMYVLGKRVCLDPVHAAFALLFTPVFLVSSTTLMCDVMMLAFWIWALHFWISGLESNRHLLLLLGAVLICAAALTKYFALALIPLLLVYSLAKKKTERPVWLVYLLLPVVVMIGYDYAARKLYGHGLLLQAFGYTAEAFGYRPHEEARSFAAIAIKGLTVLGFVGAGCAIIGLCAPLLLRRSKLIWTLVAVGLSCFLTWIVLGQMPAYSANPARFSIAIQWALAIVAGAAILVLLIADAKQNWNAETLLLALWVLGTYAFCLLNWSVNERSVLPLAPAVALLLVRRLERIGMPRGTNYCFAAAAALSLLVCTADCSLANAARTAARAIKQIDPSVTIWFEGHWGFQYYAEANGFRAYDVLLPDDPRAGDLLVLPSNNTNVELISKEEAARTFSIEQPVLPWLTTMNQSSGAGFYSDIIGPLPFAFGPVSSERYYIRRVQ